MSLDVTLIEDGEEVYEANITHNLGKMADEAGIYYELWRPKEVGATHARDIIEAVQVGLKKMEDDPDKYKEWDSSNGWGLYIHFIPWIRNYLEACKEHPDAVIEVDR